MCYSLWYNAPTMLPADVVEAEELRIQATGRQHRGCIIPQAVTQSSAPKDGRDQRPKHVELIGIINKPLLLHLVGVYIIYKTACWNTAPNMNICSPITVLLFWQT